MACNFRYHLVMTNKGCVARAVGFVGSKNFTTRTSSTLTKGHDGRKSATRLPSFRQVCNGWPNVESALEENDQRYQAKSAHFKKQATAARQKRKVTIIESLKRQNLTQGEIVSGVKEDSPRKKAKDPSDSQQQKDMVGTLRQPGNAIIGLRAGNRGRTDRSRQRRVQAAVILQARTVKTLTDNFVGYFQSIQTIVMTWKTRLNWPSPTRLQTSTVEGSQVQEKRHISSEDYVVSQFLKKLRNNPSDDEEQETVFQAPSEEEVIIFSIVTESDIDEQVEYLDEATIDLVIDMTSCFTELQNDKKASFPSPRSDVKDMVRKFRIGSTDSVHAANIWPRKGSMDENTADFIRMSLQNYHDELRHVGFVLLECINEALSLDGVSLDLSSPVPLPFTSERESSLLSAWNCGRGSRHVADKPIVSPFTENNDLSILLQDGGDCAVFQHKAPDGSWESVYIPSLKPDDPVFLVYAGDSLTVKRLTRKYFPTIPRRLVPTRGYESINALLYSAWISRDSSSDEELQTTWTRMTIQKKRRNDNMLP
ncbi:hypothetical protein IV203_003530 [Nitzschia inconspicua]|uniref:Uncharacterized protein n=1 Tax=Nitzschia inconspicua TaxID=303405 RepID=A0A9K3L2P1_9STRA|nr:hypothetical protein IV203_003530 [Nitzschia inconspicua]